MLKPPNRSNVVYISKKRSQNTPQGKTGTTVVTIITCINVKISQNNGLYNMAMAVNVKKKKTKITKIVIY